jgi:hypothetical protein
MDPHHRRAPHPRTRTTALLAKQPRKANSYTTARELDRGRTNNVSRPRVNSVSAHNLGIPLSDPDRPRASEQPQAAYEAATTGDLDHCRGI